MPALSDLPELVGFFSYSREDDEDFDRALSKLRTRIQNDLRAQLGRSRETLRLWQDREAIPPGTLWASEIQAAIDQSAFFIPIVSPRVVRSEYCSTEFQKFLERERRLGRRDLVFPILFINVPELNDEQRRREHPVLSIIAERQYVDWRKFRYDPDKPEVREEVALFCEKIAEALQRIPADEELQKRRAREAEEARRREAEQELRRAEERRTQEAEAEARAKEAEARQRAEALARSEREAEEERRRRAPAPAGVAGEGTRQIAGQGTESPRARWHTPLLADGLVRFAVGAAILMNGFLVGALFGIAPGNDAYVLIIIGLVIAAVGAATILAPSRGRLIVIAVLALSFLFFGFAFVMLLYEGLTRGRADEVWVAVGMFLHLVSLAAAALICWYGWRGTVVGLPLGERSMPQRGLLVWFLFVPVGVTFLLVLQGLPASRVGSFLVSSAAAVIVGLFVSFALLGAARRRMGRARL
jgi:hypothetical protein